MILMLPALALICLSVQPVMLLSPSSPRIWSMVRFVTGCGEYIEEF